MRFRNNQVLKIKIKKIIQMYLRDVDQSLLKKKRNNVVKNLKNSWKKIEKERNLENINPILQHRCCAYELLFTDRPLPYEFTNKENCQHKSKNSWISGSWKNSLPFQNNLDKKLSSYFDKSNLQDMWYNLAYYPTIVEEMETRELIIDDIKFTIDADGKDYTDINKGIVQRNMVIFAGKGC